MAESGLNRIEPRDTYLGKIASVAVFGFGLLIKFFLLAISTDDCHGPGATHPGGCLEFAQASNNVFGMFLIIEAVFLILILFGIDGLPRLARMILFVAFIILVLFGYGFVLWLLGPLK